jgi:hypothetical protein
VFLQGSTHQLSISLGAEGLGTLDGSSQTAVNDELGQDTNGARDTKEDGVVVGLGQTIVL